MLLALMTINSFVLMIVLLMKFNKPFKIFLGKNVVYNFINSMFEESKYCSNVMEKHVNKELVKTKQDSEDLETLCWVCANDRVNNDIKVGVHYHITEKIEALRIEIVISMLN